MEWRAAAEILGYGVMFFLAVFGDRWLASRGWRDSLTAFRLRFPRDLPVETVARGLAVLAQTSRRRPVAFEVWATGRGIGHYVLIPKRLAPAMISRLVTAIPGVRVEEAGGYLASRPVVRAAAELRTSHVWRPLAVANTESAVAGLLSSLYPLGAREGIRVQWIVAAGRPIRLRGHQPGEVVRAVRDKQAAPLAYAVGRVAVTARHRGRARLLLSGVLSAMRVVNAPNAVLSARLLPSRVVAWRVYPRALPLTWWPCVVNAAELAAVVGFPAEGVQVPGLATGTARQLPTPPVVPRRGLLLGYSNYPGMADRPLALRADDRLRHTLVAGPTGTGKSTLLANSALQDIAAGYGMVVIDPKTDLIAEILARVPADRARDVIVVDASTTDRPVGFNILRCGRDERSKELVVERVTHVLSQLWRSSWGPRTSDVIRACLLTLTHTRAANGEAFTLTELPELLTNTEFRRYVTGRPSVPESVRPFWASYEQMSDAERAQVIGPAMHRIREITTRTALRLILGQSRGIDLASVFHSRKVVLVPLAEGSVGSDAAQLLGSLLVAFLWQETLHRAVVPAEKRRPVWAYVDEFQEFVRFGGDELAKMMAMARGLGLGLVLAHQYLDQLPAHVLSAVLGTVRTQIVFQTEYGDAYTFAKRLAPLTVEDLCNQDAFEAAIRPCVGGQTLAPITGRTLPLPDRLHDPAMLASYALHRHGTPRQQAEAARRARVWTTQSAENRAAGEDLGLLPRGEE